MEEFYIQGDIKDLLMILVYGYLSIAGMWTLYLAGMNLKRNREKLTLPAKLIAYPMFIFGYLCDVAFNIVLGSIFFLDIPRQLTFTERCEGHLHEQTWRGVIARWFCRNLLDPYDPDGKHC